MNRRRMQVSWIMLIVLVLCPSQSILQAQTATSTPGPTPTPSATPLPGQEALIQPYTLTTLYGQPSIVYTDLGGDLYACQNPAQTVGSSPSDITRIEVYLVPDNFPSLSGYVIAAYTQTPFQELLNGYSAAGLLRSLTVGGQTEHRINEVHEQTFRIGAINNNNQLIDGTSQMAGVSPDGMAAVFNVPDTVSQFQITSFYTAEAGQDTTCDVAPNSGLFNLHASWANPSRWAALDSLVSGTDATTDTVVCGVGGSVDAPQVDITDVNVYPAPNTAPFPDGYVVEVKTSRVSAASDFSTMVYLNLLRGEGGEQNWLMGNVAGRFSIRVQNVDNSLDYQSSRWGEFTGTSMAEPSTSSALAIFNIPGDVTAVQARTALTAEQGGQQVCDQYPGDGSRINLPPVWMSSIVPENLVGTIEDEAGDTVDAATGAPVDAPEADITTINVFQGRTGSGNDLTFLGVPVVPPGAVADHVFRLKNVLASGETHTTSLQQSQQGQTTTHVLDGDGNTLLTAYRPAYWDELHNTTYFALFGGAAQFTVELSTTMEDGQQVVDTTDPIDVPEDLQIVKPEQPRVILCPPLDTLAPDASGLQREIRKAVDLFDDSYGRSLGDTTPGSEAPPPSFLLDAYLQLTHPSRPYHPLYNPLVFRPDCSEPDDAAPTSAPTVEDVYGAPVQTVTDPTDDPADCQNPAASMGTAPSDITGVSVHRVPENVISNGGYMIAVDTATPFQQVMDTSTSAALVVNAVTVSGERANRRLQIHEGQESSGIIDDNSQLIAGTGDFVGFDAYGRALFLVPPTATQAKITSYYMSAAGQPTLCDSTETINFDALSDSETLGELLDALGVMLCPPLDRLLERSTPLDSDRALFNTLKAFDEALFDPERPNALRLPNPNSPYHPILNPLIFSDSCLGDV